MSGETARMEGLGFALQKEAELETLTLDVLKSSLPRRVSSAGNRRRRMADRVGFVPATRAPVNNLGASTRF